METPFNLTLCHNNLPRRRTLSGTTCYYHVYFEPKGLDKHQRRIAIDSFKHPKTAVDRKTSHVMIDYAVGKFLQQYDMNDFDVILGVPSSSNIVQKIIDILAFESGFIGRGYVNYKGFVKTRIRNVKLKQHIIDQESSVKTKIKVPKAYQCTRRLHYDKVSKVSLFPTRFRRYFENFLQLNVPDRSCLLDKRVLVVDDTFGEGLTMCEVVRLLTPYTSDILGFMVMKDMQS